MSKPFVICNTVKDGTLAAENQAKRDDNDGKI